MKYKKEASESLGTLEGFLKDLPIAETYHGVRCLLNKHFPKREIAGPDCIHMTKNGECLEFTQRTKREGKKNIQEWSLYVKNAEKEEQLIWVQEKVGKEPLSSPVVLI